MRLPIATALLALAILVVDAITPASLAISWAYVLVILLAGQFLRAQGVVLVTIGCIGLTVVGYFFYPPATQVDLYVAVANRALSSAALGVTAFFVVSGQSTARALREQADYLNLTHDSMFSRTLDNVITFWNHGAQEMYGWTAEEAVGKNAQQLLHTIFPVPRDQVDAEVLRTGRWEGELGHTTRDGTPIVVASRWALQSDKNGQPVGFLETNNDVTERRKSQESLAQAQADLTRVNRIMLVGEMTASIAHEINQPLTGVISNAGTAMRWLAAKPPEIEEARHYLELILKDGNRASEVIKRIRGLVRKESQRADEVDINEAVREVVALATSELEKNRIAVQTELASNVPVVKADRVQLQQVVLNLVANSVEAMSTVGDRPRELVVVTGASDPKEVFVEVRDSGPGLDPANMDALFRSFYSTKPDGTGMGLSISRSIVEAHGGDLSAEPNHPYGAVFRFTVPTDGERAA
jgi:PAS domain S-box-containing protein